MADLQDRLKDIKRFAPPNGDTHTYLIWLRKIFIEEPSPSEMHAKLLETFNDLLQDKELANNLGWDIMPLLLQTSGSDDCLVTIARLGNPREVIIGVEEALSLLDLVGGEDDLTGADTKTEQDSTSHEPNNIDRFCLLLSLLAILHPRIKTKHPSRFLATTVLAIMRAFQSSHRATIAVSKFIHEISGKKRPTLPGRKSSLSIANIMRPELESSLPIAPDPEAQEEDIQESAIQKKLLQGLVTTMLEHYIDVYPLEWAARLQESFDPKRVVAGRTTLAEAFQTKPEFQIRETVVGQLVALSHDLEIVNYDLLFETIYSTEPIAHAPDPEENLPDSAEDIPLSPNGCLYLLASLLFSSIMFKTKTPEPTMSIFPDHAKLVARFFEAAVESPLTIPDAVLAIGLWLEHTNKFVAGEFKDNDFIAQLRALSIWSATNPSPGLRYCAHRLTSAILHAHPVDMMRLSFISKTLQDSADEMPNADALKASAITWLKEELITAHDRKSDNLFSTTAAILETKSHIFPALSSFANSSDDELVEELAQKFTLHMTALNFLFFITTEQYATIVPLGMKMEVEASYLAPLRIALDRALKSLDPAEDADPTPHMEVELLSEQIAMCIEKLHEK